VGAHDTRSVQHCNGCKRQTACQPVGRRPHGARRLRRFAARRAAPRTPAELVRRRYEELERRLLRAGHVRSPWTTVRAFLLAVWAGGSPAPAVDLAVIYELARYSDHSVDDSTARRFEALAAEFGSPRPGAA
jgi:hypothetical protein